MLQLAHEQADKILSVIGTIVDMKLEDAERLDEMQEEGAKTIEKLNPIFKETFKNITIGMKIHLRALRTSLDVKIRTINEGMTIIPLQSLIKSFGEVGAMIAAPELFIKFNRMEMQQAAENLFHEAFKRDASKTIKTLQPIVKREIAATSIYS